MLDNTIYVAWGETLKFTIPLGTDNDDIDSITFYVGDVGSSTPLLTVLGTIADGVASFRQQSVTSVPKGEHRYQLKAVTNTGDIEKWPDVEGYTDELPHFVVTEALDEVGDA